MRVSFKKIKNLRLKNAFLNFPFYEVPEQNVSAYSFSGNHQKKILIAFVDEGDEFFTYLQRVLSSVKINLVDDCLLLKINAEDVDLPRLHELQRESNFSKAIFFGISPKQLGFQIDLPKDQEIIKIQNTEILFTDALSDIQKSSATQRGLLRDNLLILIGLIG